jgi:hypothetical protein
MPISQTVQLVVRRISYRISAWRLAKRHPNPYATHLPVLIGLSRLFRVERVVEFGSGENSTLIFLNKQIFPHVMFLQSFENDVKWLDAISSKTATDPRIQMHAVDRDMYCAAAESNIENYDLVFIDDSFSIEQRSKTIHAVALQHPKQGIVLVHDSEVIAYQNAAQLFKNRFYFTGFNPNTGLFWNEKSIKRRSLSQLNSLIRANATQIDPGDVLAWRALFLNHLPSQSQ